MYFTFNAALSGGWDALRNNYGPVLGCTLLFFLITFATGFIPLAGLVATILVIPPLQAGWMYSGVKAFRGRDLTVNDLFIGFQHFPQTLGIYWLQQLLIFLCMVPLLVVFAIAAAVSDGSAEPLAIGLVIGGVAVSVVLTIMISVRLGFAFLVCIDRECGAMDSLRYSWAVTKDIAWPLFGVHAVAILIMAASLLCLVLPFFFLGFPLYVCIIGASYALRIGESVENVF